MQNFNDSAHKAYLSLLLNIEIPAFDCVECFTTICKISLISLKSMGINITMELSVYFLKIVYYPFSIFCLFTFINILLPMIVINIRHIL